MASADRGSEVQNEVNAMTIAQTILLGILASNGLFVFIQYLITRHDEKKKEAKETEQKKQNEEQIAPLKDALLALCSERLESLLRKWLHADPQDRTASRWASIKYLYKAYKALEGNGDIEALFDIAKELKPTKE